MGTLNFKSFGVVSVWSSTLAWWNMRGISVIPESKRPFTPIFVLSKSLTSAILSQVESLPVFNSN